jgi:hypothetical protein
MPARADFIGRKFGHLTVVGHAPGKGAGTRWVCACDCGRSCTKLGKDLTKKTKAGWVHSCGCRADLAKSIRKKVRDDVDPRLRAIHKKRD